ncbi:hypothetical protein DC094_02410 [Pelagibaculum spongiae]|uniref:Uncharacterized protein n=1 Tax=Pelagibaculum spongiae TaxID=2080658 RepID=A0A2V1GXS5_9GAMM|nr:hypothetical protein DC094_02410 [Pelagibaculum spongiae]
MLQKLKAALNARLEELLSLLVDIVKCQMALRDRHGWWKFREIKGSFLVLSNLLGIELSI